MRVLYLIRQSMINPLDTTERGEVTTFISESLATIGRLTAEGEEKDKQIAAWKALYEDRVNVVSRDAELIAGLSAERDALLAKAKEREDRDEDARFAERTSL